METQMSDDPAPPLAGNLRVSYVSSALIALLTAAASIVSLAGPTAAYPSQALRQAFLPNDLVSLVLTTPVLLGSMFAAARGRFLGLLFWPGALFVVVYNSLAYVVALPLSIGFVLHLLLAAASVYTIPNVVSKVTPAAVHERLDGAIPTRFVGSILAGMGVLFFALAIGTLVAGLGPGARIARTELGVHAADVLIAPAWLIGGVALLRRRPFGYVVSPGLILQATALFVGVVLVLVLQPLVTDMDFDATATVTVAVMSLLAIVPFIVVVVSVVRSRRA